jgi:tetratricopeptide (TPR) repeat protein
LNTIACALLLLGAPPGDFWARTLARPVQLDEWIREGDERLAMRLPEHIVQAESAYAAALRLDARDFRARMGHAEALERMGRFAECAAELEIARALDAHREAGPLAMALGLCRARSGAYVEAALEYRRALDAQAGVVLGLAHFNLADVEMARGQLDEALRQYGLAAHTALAAPSGSLLARSRPVIELAAAMARDRAGEDVLARLLSGQGDLSLHQILLALASQVALFFVPPEDRFYALALAYEAAGERARAVEYWREYLRVAPGARYHSRAEWHLARLARSIGKR